MGSTTSSLGSSSGSGSSSTIAFNGISSYASDFQSILQRAVAIAQLPITALQNEESDNQDKITALQSLNPDVANLGSAVTALGQLAANGGGLAANSSDPSTVSVVNTGATSPATYTISNIQSLASSAWATTGSFASSTTPVSADGNVQLTVGSNTYNLSLTSANNNLTGLAEAINNAGAGVTANILTTSGGDYLSISANSPGQATIQLQDMPTTTDQVTNTGTGTETSTATYASFSTTPVSMSGQMSLVVGSNTYQLNLTGNNNLSGLVSAINNAGAGVTATTISGTNSYSFSISTNDGSAQTIQLNDNPTNLIASSSAGSDAVFTLNGNVQVTEPNNTINDVIPGVSFTLENTTTDNNETVTLSLSADSSQLSSALETFVDDYNQLATDVSQDVGSTGGALNGDLIINSIMTDMQQLTSYWNPSGTSTIRSLSDLGVTFNDTSGQLTFDQSVVNGLSNTQLSDAMSFLGSSNSGFAALASNFTQLSDPIDGIIETEETAYQNDDTNLSSEISDKQTQLSQMQTNLTSQLEAADALCEELESEQNTITASIESLNYVTYGVNYNSNGTPE